MQQILPEGFYKMGKHVVCEKDNSLLTYIPEGWFSMGPALDWELGTIHDTLRRIYLDSYFIDLNPVNNEQFAKFIECGGYEKEEYWPFRESTEYKQLQEERHKAGKSHPYDAVTAVSWFEANAYAMWCNKKLPTEAQWVKANRGGLEDRYVPQINVPEMAWEWCSDYYDEGYYRYMPEKNPTGTTRKGYRVIQDSFMRLPGEDVHNIAMHHYPRPECIGFRTVMCCKDYNN
ncbi:formylglycine-generating enzyme family protein [Candidatus Uabimicrobium amorphum]|uniref:Serine/threonine-protein kinase pkn1 n=1 Tax=Uabimicrobium amorphum TaxID=2596890 RepID=A0A5S9F520_UABAM|nr:SUMF1/EgtB/PvdO family nonheme iron enzyme [Candidatus Uabimicrobium amorphum]BBM86376.1 serine/threonine-protein kinase pkn1 [Candidatus Uabimicrobium amorphum]